MDLSNDWHHRNKQIKPKMKFCRRCSLIHKEPNKCPAYNNKVCFLCQKNNHFARACFSNRHNKFTQFIAAAPKSQILLDESQKENTNTNTVDNNIFLLEKVDTQEKGTQTTLKLYNEYGVQTKLLSVKNVELQTEIKMYNKKSTFISSNVSTIEIPN